MHEPSRILASATAVLLLAAAMPAAASHPATSTWADPPIPSVFYAILRSAPDPVPRILQMMLGSGPDPVCDEVQRPARPPVLLERWRQWWNARTSRRGGRETEVRRPAHTPFYLRSPMLSGFFGWGEPNRCDEAAAEREAAPRQAPGALGASDDSAEGKPEPQP